ncbi:MAG TPA: LppX_LprAFG lipoprotein [Anaerolineales bacterium]|nr:LppX_LprAFG lipoprotein [Anaerolineales bacterium]
MKTQFRNLAIAAALLAACGPTPTPTPTPDELLDRAGEAVLAMTSAQFALTREGAPAVLDPQTNTTFSEATGQYLAPDRVSATAKVTLFGTVAEIQMLWVPEGVYISNPLTGALTKTTIDTAFNGAAMFGVNGAAAVLKDGLTNVQLVGTEKIDEIDAYHLKGEADGAKLGPLTAGALAADKTYPVDVWMDVATSNLVRIHVAESETDGWLLELFDINVPVEIKAP